MSMLGQVTMVVRKGTKDMNHFPFKLHLPLASSNCREGGE
jgi:hypothetical protein